MLLYLGLASDHSIGVAVPNAGGGDPLGRGGMDNIDQSMALTINLHSVSQHLGNGAINNRTRKQRALYDGTYTKQLEIWNKKFHLHYALACANTGTDPKFQTRFIEN